MQFFLGLLLLGSLVYAVPVQQPYELLEPNTAYGYIKKIGIPTAEKIRQAEEQKTRIVGGVPAALGQYPFQTGLLGDIIGFTGLSVCGGSLISSSRVLTAAHCWFDGTHQAWRFTVVLGSVTLFQGGTRMMTSAIATHPSWIPALARNDVAVIYLPTTVATSATIAPVALPSGSELFESFAGEQAIAVGFGLTRDDGVISETQYMSHVNLNVITNSACSIGFPLLIQASHICTSGIGGAGTCRGDSGGPLVLYRNNRQVLIGVSSFVSPLGCQSAMPAAYTRVTSFSTFINQHI